MNRKGFTLVEIMIVVAIIALLAAIAIPNLLRSRMTANESAAQSTLRTISTALETYAAANNGAYPTTEAALTSDTPPYLNKAYFTDCVAATPCSGYIYTKPINTATTYCVQAAPASTSAGTSTYSVSTGGVLAPAVCTTS